MVFGMISAAITGPPVWPHGKINATVYKDILKKHAPNLRTAINYARQRSVSQNEVC